MNLLLSLLKLTLLATTTFALLFACARSSGPPFYSATAFAAITANVPFAQGKLAAIKEAELKARDQVMLEAQQLKFSNGKTLEDAAIMDPFIRAKLYDTIRTAKITDQTIDEANKTVTVTVQMDLAPLLEITRKYTPEG